MSVKIILERHGQSVGNAKGIYLGHTDLGLTDEGIEQARITAEHLLPERIDAIYSSDLKRAYETAMPHAVLRNLEIKTSEKLREIFVGDWEGASVPVLKSEQYDEFVIRRTYRDFVYPNGESTYHAAERMRAELLKICEENPERSVLVVSHSAVIRAFWYYLSGYTEENMTDRVQFMPNAAYCTLTYENGVLIPERYGISDHLPETSVHPI